MPAKKPEARKRETASELRVLVTSHSHPQRTRGGAEISAQALFHGLREKPGLSAWFLGCSDASREVRIGARISQPFGADDFVYTPGAQFEYFKLANRDPEFPRALAALVRELRPDIVHAHHYLQFGVEAFSIIKRAYPPARVVLSLHEYFGICNNNGQMVKTGSHRLCSRESPADCAACFPDFAPRDFFLRKRYIQGFFEDVDLFLSPSRFLADRYVAWGVPAAKMAVLENVPRAAWPSPPQFLGTAAGDMERRELRFGFFGQMSPLKGISVLIEAARQLAAAEVDDVMIEIYGDYSSQPLPFQSAVEAALEEAGRNVTYHGPYDNERVQDLMQSVDAVLVPSIWWENSPVVIQEAFASGKPVICSNIGGLAEKVRHGTDGLHFEVGRAASLARTLESLARDPERLIRLTNNVCRPPTPAESVGAHLALYRKLIAERSPPG